MWSMWLAWPSLQIHVKAIPGHCPHSFWSSYYWSGGFCAQWLVMLDSSHHIELIMVNVIRACNPISFEPQGGNSNKWLQGACPKFSQMHRLRTHNRTHNLNYVSNSVDYVSNYLDSRVSKEKRERSHWEKLGRELGVSAVIFKFL